MKNFLKTPAASVRGIIWGLVAVLTFATLTWAATVNKFPQGVASHYFYDYTEATRTQGDYYASIPTLTANDTFMTLGTDQTVTGTKTGGTYASPTLSGTIPGSPTVSGNPTFTGSPQFYASRTKEVRITSWNQFDTVGGVSVYKIDPANGNVFIFHPTRICTGATIITGQVTAVMCATSSTNDGTAILIGKDKSDTGVTPVIVAAAYDTSVTTYFKALQNLEYTYATKHHDTGVSDWGIEEAGDYKLWILTASAYSAVSAIQKPGLPQSVVDDLVTENATQTLTSKTLTSPAISAPTISGSGTLSGTLTGSNGTLSGVTQVNPPFVMWQSTEISYVAGTGYTISGASQGMVFEVPLSGVTEQQESDNCPIAAANNGVTVEVPTPTATTNGRIIGIRNTSASNVTGYVVRCGGLPVGAASGTTVLGGEDQGDITWLQLCHNNGVSVYVINRFNAD